MTQKNKKGHKGYGVTREKWLQHLQAMLDIELLKIEATRKQVEYIERLMMNAGGDENEESVSEAG